MTKGSVRTPLTHIRPESNIEHGLSILRKMGQQARLSRCGRRSSPLCGRNENLVLFATSRVTDQARTRACEERRGRGAPQATSRVRGRPRSGYGGLYETTRGRGSCWRLLTQHWCGNRYRSADEVGQRNGHGRRSRFCHREGEGSRHEVRCRQDDRSDRPRRKHGRARRESRRQERTCALRRC